ncbi:MAG: hypothetical protein O2800_03450 [Planctomycetota bacterium]|nr:hypothetical protein [Planctomycetota bacterium]
MSGFRALLVLAGAVVASGCTSRQLSTQTISAPSFHLAWTSALEQLHEDGYRIAMADEGQGLIETTPKREGSWLDPWAIDEHQTLGDVSEATAARERRVIRVRFTSVGKATTQLSDSTAPLTGSALPGSLGDIPPLTADPSQPVDISIVAVIERMSRPFSNPSAWSGSLESSYRVGPSEVPVEGVRPPPADYDRWIPVRSDAKEATRLSTALGVRCGSATIRGS